MLRVPRASGGMGEEVKGEGEDVCAAGGGVEISSGGNCKWWERREMGRTIPFWYV